MGPIALFVVLLLLPVGAVLFLLAVGVASLASRLLDATSLALVPLCLVGALVGLVAGRRIGKLGKLS